MLFRPHILSAIMKRPKGRCYVGSHFGSSIIVWAIMLCHWRTVIFCM